MANLPRANLPSFFRPGALWARSESPFRELNRLQRQLDRMMEEWPFSEESWRPSAMAGAVMTPAVDVEETDTHYILSFDLPGIKKEDLKVELLNNELRVSGERKEEHEEKTKTRFQSERFQGNFFRSFSLPMEVKPEQIETHYSDGVLRIGVPKAEAAKSHLIQIAEGKQGLFQKLLGQTKKKTEPEKAA